MRKQPEKLERAKGFEPFARSISTIPKKPDSIDLIEVSLDLLACLPIVPDPAKPQIAQPDRHKSSLRQARWLRRVNDEMRIGASRAGQPWSISDDVVLEQWCAGHPAALREVAAALGRTLNAAQCRLWRLRREEKSCS